MSEETWKDILAYDQPKGFQPPHWCAVLLEVTIFLSIGIVAALLRFTDWAPIFQHQNLIFQCADPFYNLDALSNNYTGLFYTSCLLLPLLLIIVCEFERSYYSLDPNYKTFTASQRFFYISLRPIGIFVLGIFLVSTVTDFMKAQIALPRPYFFSQYPKFCKDATIVNASLSMDERYGLTSFPCHLSALSAFTTFLVACYIHSSVSLNGAPVVKPTIICCLFLLTISGSIYRVNINYNHWIDVIFGLMIGSGLAYIMNLVLLQSYKSHKQVMTENAWRLLLPRVSLPKFNGSSATIDRTTVHSVQSHSNQIRSDRGPNSKRNGSYWYPT